MMAGSFLLISLIWFSFTPQGTKFIMRLFLISSVRLSIILIFSAVTLAAQDSSERKPKKHYIGYGNLITNDLLGDGRDRWRTGSVSSSHIWGVDWKGELPEELSKLVEIRMFGEVIAPSDLSGNNGIDRPFVSHLALGMHSHFQHNGLEYSTGIEASFLGKQTGLSDFGEKSRKGTEAQSWIWAGAKQNRRAGFHAVLAVDPLQLIGFARRDGIPL